MARHFQGADSWSLLQKQQTYPPFSKDDAISRFFEDKDFKNLLLQSQLGQLAPANQQQDEGVTDLIMGLERFHIGKEAPRRELNRQLAQRILEMPPEIQEGIMDAIPWDIQEELVFKIERRLKPIWELKFGIHPSEFMSSSDDEGAQHARLATIARLVKLLRLSFLVAKKAHAGLHNTDTRRYVWNNEHFGGTKVIRHEPQDWYLHMAQRQGVKPSEVDLKKVWKAGGGLIRLPDHMHSSFAKITVFRILRTLITLRIQPADQQGLDRFFILDPDHLRVEGYQLFVWVLRDSSMRDALREADFTQLYHSFFQAAVEVGSGLNTVIRYWKHNRGDWARWEKMHEMAKAADFLHLYPANHLVFLEILNILSPEEHLFGLGATPDWTTPGDHPPAEVVVRLLFQLDDGFNLEEIESTIFFDAPGPNFSNLFSLSGVFDVLFFLLANTFLEQIAPPWQMTTNVLAFTALLRSNSGFEWGEGPNMLTLGHNGIRMLRARLNSFPLKDIYEDERFLKDDQLESIVRPKGFLAELELRARIDANMYQWITAEERQESFRNPWKSWTNPKELK